VRQLGTIRENKEGSLDNGLPFLARVEIVSLVQFNAPQSLINSYGGRLLDILYTFVQLSQSSKAMLQEAFYVGAYPSRML